MCPALCEERFKGRDLSATGCLLSGYQGLCGQGCRSPSLWLTEFAADGAGSDPEIGEEDSQTCGPLLPSAWALGGGQGGGAGSWKAGPRSRS